MNEHSASIPQPTASVADRLKYLIRLGRMTQAQFAEKIGMNPSNISKVLTGKMAISEAMINRVVVDMGVSKAWLRDGKGVPFEKNSSVMKEIVPPKEVSALPSSGTPIYDIDVTAGCRELGSLFTVDRIVGSIDLPGISGQDYAIVTVSGDSMYPAIKNGAFLAIRRMSLSAPIHWGQIYVVVLEDFRMVKYVRRHPDPDKVYLHSENPSYDDIEVSLSQIKDLYIVEGVLTYEKRS